MSREVKKVSTGIAAVAGACALVAAGSFAGVATASQAQSGQGGASGTATTRCTTADLSVSLGELDQHGDAVGQFDVPLTFTNISSHTCGLYGVPGVDLIGPDDPNGLIYHLTRVDNGVAVNDVPPGTTATAVITVLTPTEGSVGSGGSTSWTPTRLETTPPGQTEALSVDWPSDLPVLRQDAATHPGSYVNGILADPV